MPHLMRGLLLTGLLTLIGCGLFGIGEEKPPPMDPYFTAQLNGERWEGESRAGLTGTKRLDIEGDSADPQSFWHEELIFTVPFTGPQSYSLVRDENQGGIYMEVDGDAVIAFYYPTDVSSANRMEITSYDAERGIMEGTFRTTVVVSEEDRDVSERRRPDTLRFTDGRFRVQVEDHREE